MPQPVDFKYLFPRILLGGRHLMRTNLGLMGFVEYLPHSHSLPKAQYIPVCKEGGSFATSNKSVDSSAQTPKEFSVLPAADSNRSPRATSNGANQESGKDVPVQVATDNLKDSKKLMDSRGEAPSSESREEPLSKSISEFLFRNQYLSIERREAVKGKGMGKVSGP